MREVDVGFRQKIISNNNLEGPDRDREACRAGVVHRPVPPVSVSGSPYIALRQEIWMAYVLARALLVVMTHLRR